MPVQSDSDLIPRTIGRATLGASAFTTTVGSVAYETVTGLEFGPERTTEVIFDFMAYCRISVPASTIAAGVKITAAFKMVRDDGTTLALLAPFNWAKTLAIGSAETVDFPVSYIGVDIIPDTAARIYSVQAKVDHASATLTLFGTGGGANQSRARLVCRIP